MSDEQSEMNADSLEYVDFEIEIGEGSDHQYPVSFRPTAAEDVRATMQFPYSEHALASALKDIEIALLRSSGTRRKEVLPEEKTVQTFGQALFNALFVGEIRSRYYASHQQTLNQGKGLRLKLNIHAPELAALPWEFLYDPRRGEYVGLSRYSTIIRTFEESHPIAPLPISAPLRVLGMIAAPIDQKQLDIQREQRKITDALAELVQQGRVELSWLPGQTGRDLQQAMRRGPWHAFHFIGEGGFDVRTDEGFINLADETGRTERLYATDLGRLLTDHRSLRLVVLNSCEGGRGSSRNVFSSVAALLLRQRVPAVVGMQYEISDAAAIEFAREFYESLADSLPVGAAVNEARKALSRSQTLEWGIPVLYMSASDSVLFKIEPKPSPPLDSQPATIQRHLLSPPHTRHVWKPKQLVAALVSLLVGLPLAYWEMFLHKHVAYYANVISRWGLPEGVGKLTTEQFGRRYGSVEFSWHGWWGPVEEIRVVSSKGQCRHAVQTGVSLDTFNYLPVESSQTPGYNANTNICHMTFLRDSAGHVDTVRAYTLYDRLIYTLKYTDPAVAQYIEEGFNKSVRPSGITLLRFVRPTSGPDRGLDQEVHFLGSDGKPQPDEVGAFGLRLAFDQRGLAVEKVSLGNNNEPKETQEEVLTDKTEYDHWGNPITEFLYDDKSKPVVNKFGIASGSLSYDGFGNLVKTQYGGTDGQPTIMKKLGAAGLTMAYDDHGNLSEITMFGPDGPQQLVTGALGYSRVTLTRDEKGNYTRTYFDPDGKISLQDGRYAKAKCLLDAYERCTEEWYLDENDHPILTDAGVAGIKTRYDDQGNIGERTCFDENDHPVRSTFGYAKVQMGHDQYGNTTVERFFGPNGKPEFYDEPYVTIMYRYNAQNKRIEQSYIDTNNKPINNSDGFAKTTSSYDPLSGNLIAVAFFDGEDKPTLRMGGYAQIVRKYDGHGNEIEEKVLDRDGNPARSDKGFCTIKYEHDERGYTTKVSYFDEHDRPTLHSDGYAALHAKYNNQGQEIERTSFGLDGTPIVFKRRRYAKRQSTYDSYGKVVRFDYFDLKGQRTLITSGFATIKYTYDDFGRETKREYFDSTVVFCLEGAERSHGWSLG